jgi:hypothetical protein
MNDGLEMNWSWEPTGPIEFRPVGKRLCLIPVEGLTASRGSAAPESSTHG